MLLDPQPLAQKPYNGVEALICAEFEHALGEMRGGTDRLETDGDLSQISLFDPNMGIWTW